jgi:proteasome lid subunit RPN8/RPN11
MQQEISKRMVIHLSEMAFTSMVLAALEAFRKETYGLLLGQKTKEGLIVQYAIPYQTAERHTSWVSRNEVAHTRMENFLRNLHHVNLIGDFHSHTQRGDRDALCRLSAMDKKGLASNDICLVIALNKRQKYQPWKSNIDGSLSGTVEEFFVKIGGWHLGKNGDHSSARGELVCPFALGSGWK